MRKRNTESIGEVLKQYFEENPFIRRKLAESRAVLGWERMLGRTVASYTQNVYLRNNTLYVSLTSSVLRAELIGCKERLISGLNQQAGMDIVREIIFR